MKDSVALAILLPFCLLIGGCSSAQWEDLRSITKGPSVEVGRSATRVDDEAKSYYEDQIMDNLVREANGKLFVQTDLNNLGAVIGWKLAANVGASRAGVDSGTRAATNSTVTTQQTTINKPLNTSSNVILSAVQNTVAGTLGVVNTAVSMVTRNYSATVSPEHDNTLTMNASPVVQDPNIANAYILYLNLTGKQSKPYNPFAGLWYQSTDFPDSVGLIKKLSDSNADPLAKYLWGRFPKKNQDDPTQIMDAVGLAAALNSILQGPSIYKLDRFQGFKLSDDTFALLSKQTQLTTTNEVPPSGPTGDEVVRLNRLLLEDYFRKDAVKYVAKLGKELRKQKPMTSEQTDGTDFSYEIKAPDAVTKLEKRTHGFDFPNPEMWPDSIKCVEGGPKSVPKDRCVPGAMITFAPDEHGSMQRVTWPSLYKKGARTYYIPKDYANAFFHLCTAIVSRAPTKAGASQGGAGQKPITPALLIN